MLSCAFAGLAIVSLLLQTSHAAVLQARLSQSLNPYPNKPRVTFAADGTFKITVFSDLHYGENAWDVWGPQQDVNSTALMNKVLPDEKPDYVVLNGDLITGENGFKENATVYIDQIVGPLNKLKIPFSSTHGNHDNQANISHIEEIIREQHDAPLSYTRTAPPGIGGPSGPGTYWVPVYANKKASKPSLILWFFDSQGGFSEGANEPLPDWVDDTVAGWIEEQTAMMDAAWGPAAQNRGALVFVHIPPHAIQQVQTTLDNTTNPGLNDDFLGEGSTQATSDPANNGKDQVFWDALNTHVKNIHAVISGHDHGNEWCAREPTKNVIFCFDKHSGYGGYSSATWGHGVRNVVFQSTKPQDSIQTWIRLEEGETRARVTLDKNYQ
ncbi:hypothetical protein EIP91_011432 [Steccherinum ochraceum]|uniref:Calcineurin-like phosphoesterase domain-containing protein n=1 Tax=Steccherinum ochraceum TaxID=92696 RepID=A0A4R0RYF9_9APHY|nr:hypothetical protein EIP91_011432 [Steccherinum ochraceum]